MCDKGVDAKAENYSKSYKNLKYTTELVLLNDSLNSKILALSLHIETSL